MDDETPAPYPCLTPSCNGRARAKWGRHGYCLPCQVRRGTRTPDGKLVTGLIPTAPGSRSGRDAGGRGPLERKAFVVVQAGRRLDHILRRHQRVRADVEEGLAAWQLQARELVATGRELDHAIRRRGKLKGELEAALVEWAQAIEELPRTAAVRIDP